MEFAEAPDNILEQLRKERTQEKCSKCPHWSKPSDKYFEAMLERVASTTKGGRNQALNDAAWSIARWIAGAELDEHFYHLRLLQAATDNGLMDDPDDGPQSVQNTIESGWSAGLKNPHTVAKEPVSLNEQSAGLSSNVKTASLEPNFGLLVMTGPELLSDAAHLQDLPFLPLLSIDGYFVKGWSHLVSGYPRVGKTDLLLACCRQWLRMGERVLYITEEPVTIWQHRLKMWSGEWTNLQVAFGLGADPEVLRKLAREGAATLVVVDALRNLLRLKDEKDNSEIARVVNPWVADARAAEKTLFIAHHQRKGGGEHGEGISGGHALMGAFDIPIEVLWDPSKGTNRRLVRTYPRLIEAKEGLYEKVADGEFEYFGDPQAVALVEVTDRAKSLLTDVSQTTDEIWAGMDEPKPSKEQVRKALTDLAKQKVALRDPSIDLGPARGRPHSWRRPDAGSSEASATGSELSSNDTVYALEPNSSQSLHQWEDDGGATFSTPPEKPARRVFK